jgi:hypothetical protein
LKKNIARLKSNQDYNVDDVLEAKQELDQLMQDAKILIDLNNWVFVFLEPPHPETWAIMKPILSHDSYEIEHPYVYDVAGMGFKVKKVVTRGWPAFIFCTAKDESNWPAWPEIVSRCMLTGPNMIPEKYEESNDLIAQLKGLPSKVQQKAIVSKEQIELTKKCLLYIKGQIQEYCNKGYNPVWIPFYRILAKALPAEKGIDTRAAKRIFSLLGIIPLTKAHLRPTLTFDSDKQVTAMLEDLHETLHITQNVSGIPTFKMALFKNIICQLWTKSEDKHLTTRQICDYYKTQTGKHMSSSNLRKRYLTELVNAGLVEEETSTEDKREKWYYPLIDSEVKTKVEIQLVKPSTEQKGDKNARPGTNMGLEAMSHNFSYPFAIKPSKNLINIPENWLKFEILALTKYGTGLDKIVLQDSGNNRLSIDQFVDLYEKNDRLVPYFQKPNFKSYSSGIFGNMQCLDGNGKNSENNCGTGGSSTALYHSTAFSESKAVKANSLNEKPPPRPPIGELHEESWNNKPIPEEGE